MGPMGRLEMLRELDLTEDQRQQVRALFDEVEATGVPRPPAPGARVSS